LVFSTFGCGDSDSGNNGGSGGSGGNGGTGGTLVTVSGVVTSATIAGGGGDVIFVNVDVADEVTVTATN